MWFLSGKWNKIAKQNPPVIIHPTGAPNWTIIHAGKHLYENQKPDEWSQCLVSLPCQRNRHWRGRKGSLESPLHASPIHWQQPCSMERPSLCLKEGEQWLWNFGSELSFALYNKGQNSADAHRQSILISPSQRGIIHSSSWSLSSGRHHHCGLKYSGVLNKLERQSRP